MNREDLEGVVKNAISKSNGKGMSEAIRIICDNVEAFIEIHLAREAANREQPFVVKEEINTQYSPSVVLSDRIAELKPITPSSANGKPSAGAPREYFQSAEIMDILTRKAPASIEVTPAGYTEPLVLKRHITAMGTSPEGVQLSYRPTGATIETPWPKEHFWATDEEINIGPALDKITSDATKMYATRSGPIVSRVTTMAPVEQRMNKAGDVS